MTKSVAALERQVDQLIARVRDLETEIANLRDEAGLVRRGYLEGVLAGIESGQTPAAALGAVSSGDQTVSSGTATLLEIVDVAGTLKLRPVQAADGSDKKTLTYANCAPDVPVARATSKSPMLLVKLRDGRFVRFPAGAGATTEITVVTALQVTGSALQFKTRTAKVIDPSAESAWTDLLLFGC